MIDRIREYALYRFIIDNSAVPTKPRFLICCHAYGAYWFLQSCYNQSCQGSKAAK